MRKSLCFMSLVLASQGFASLLPATRMQDSDPNNGTNQYASSAVVPKQESVRPTSKVQVTFTTISGDDPLVVAQTASQFARHFHETPVW